MPDDETLEQRIARLEDIAFEGEGLTRAVTRLGVNANALGEALLTVDRNQQALAKLGKELKEVDDKIVPIEVIDEKVEEGQRARRRQLLALAACTATLFGIVFYVSDSAHDACENRQRATMAVRDTLASFQDPANPNTKITAGVTRLQSTLDQTCDEQYRLHF